MRVEVRQGEGGQPSDAEALVLPGQEVVRQIDLLVHHAELQLRVQQGRHPLQVLQITGFHENTKAQENAVLGAFFSSTARFFHWTLTAISFCNVKC